jgi:hypothetical protein
VPRQRLLDLRRLTPAYRWVVLVFGIVAYATSRFARQNYTGIYLANLRTQASRLKMASLQA